MKLKPRTTYLSHRGTRVSIAGLAKCPPIEGQTIYWSIQGDWYAEDGRFVGATRKFNPRYGQTIHVNGLPAGREGPYLYDRVLLPTDSGRSIKEELTTKEAKDWWKGVAPTT